MFDRLIGKLISLGQIMQAGETQTHFCHLVCADLDPEVVSQTRQDIVVAVVVTEAWIMLDL